MKKTNWFIYTVIAGLIPLFVRFLIYIISTDKPFVFVLNIVDITLYGLILLITNINELEGGEDSFSKTSRRWYIGLSVMQIVLFAALLGITYSSEGTVNSFDHNKMRILSIIMTSASFIMSFSIYIRFKSENSLLTQVPDTRL